MYKFHHKTSQTVELIDSNRNYPFETSISRLKRGLFHAVGSIFKAITDDLLYASDAERYENLIKPVQFNQQKLSFSITYIYMIRTP